MDGKIHIRYSPSYKCMLIEGKVAIVKLSPHCATIKQEKVQKLIASKWAFAEYIWQLFAA